MHRRLVAGSVFNKRNGNFYEYASVYCAEFVSKKYVIMCAIDGE